MGNFFNSVSINCDNPFLPVNSLGTIGCTPAAVAAGDSVTMYIGRRNVEGGGRQQSFANNSFRAVAGLRGAIDEAWAYDSSAQYSSVSANTSTLNYFVKSRITRSLDVIDVGGVPTCRSVLDGSDPNCVPWNPFQPGGVDSNQLDYLQGNGLQIGRINQEIYNAAVTGDLGVYGIKSPLASDGIQVVFGTEWRRDTLQNTVDRCNRRTSCQAPAEQGRHLGRHQREDLFLEGRVPIAQDVAFAPETLSFDTAYRYSDYGQSITSDTYKVGLEWAPIEPTSASGPASSVPFVPPISSSCSPHRASTCSMLLVILADLPCRIRLPGVPRRLRIWRSAWQRGVPAAQFGSTAPGQPGWPVLVPAGRYPRA